MQPLARVFNLLGADVERWFREMPRTKTVFQGRLHIDEQPVEGARKPQRLTLAEHYRSEQCLVCGQPTEKSEWVELVQATHVADFCPRRHLPRLPPRSTGHHAQHHQPLARCTAEAAGHDTHLRLVQLAAFRRGFALRVSRLPDAVREEKERDRARQRARHSASFRKQNRYPCSTSSIRVG